jgi:hypothetical protein
MILTADFLWPALKYEPLEFLRPVHPCRLSFQMSTNIPVYGLSWLVMLRFCKVPMAAQHWSVLHQECSRLTLVGAYLILKHSPALFHTLCFKGLIFTQGTQSWSNMMRRGHEVATHFPPQPTVAFIYPFGIIKWSPLWNLGRKEGEKNSTCSSSNQWWYCNGA